MSPQSRTAQEEQLTPGPDDDTSRPATGVLKTVVKCRSRTLVHGRRPELSSGLQESPPQKGTPAQKVTPPKDQGCVSPQKICTVSFEGFLVSRLTTTINTIDVRTDIAMGSIPKAILGTTRLPRI